MRNLALACAALLLAGCLLAGCSGQPNPDAAGADLERRERALQASVGPRASLARRHAERPAVAYDVTDVLCADPPLSSSTTEDGVLQFHEDEEDGCQHVDLDELVDLLRLRLGDAHGRVGLAGTDLDVLVVEASWTAHAQVGALLAERAAAPRSCRRCPRHGRPDHGRGEK